MRARWRPAVDGAGAAKARCYRRGATDRSWVEVAAGHWRGDLAQSGHRTPQKATERQCDAATLSSRTAEMTAREQSTASACGAGCANNNRAPVDNGGAEAGGGMQAAQVQYSPKVTCTLPGTPAAQAPVARTATANGACCNGKVDPSAARANTPSGEAPRGGTRNERDATRRCVLEGRL